MSDHDRTPSPDHPDALLAGLVDGTLTRAERADVRAHLAGCARCREELRLAESARRALGSLPELDAPWGLGRAAVDESRRGGRSPQFRRVGAFAAAAAAVVLVAGVAFALLHGGSSGAGQSAAPASLPTGEASPPKLRYLAPGAEGGPAFSRSRVDYSDNAIQSLASDAARRAQTTRSAEGGGSAPPAPSVSGAAGPSTSGPAGTTGPATTSQAGTHDAAAASAAQCLARAGDLPSSAVASRIIEARFQGIPAYIGIYLAGPETGQPPSRVEIWVASREDCSFIQYASRRIR